MQSFNDIYRIIIAGKTHKIVSANLVDNVFVYRNKLLLIDVHVDGSTTIRI